MCNNKRKVISSHECGEGEGEDKGKGESLHRLPISLEVVLLFGGLHLGLPHRGSRRESDTFVLGVRA